MKRWLLLFFLLFAPSIVSAQTVTSSDGSAESGTTNAVFAYDAATTNPSVLFACACTGASQASAISDTGTHTWNAVAGVTDAGGSSRCWYADNTSTNAPTVTVTALTTFVIGVGIELTGAATSSSLEQTGTAVTTGTSITVTSGSVTSSTQKVVAFGCSYNSSVAWTATTGNTENKEHNTSSGYSAVIMSKDATTGLSGAQTIVMDRPSSQTMSGVIGTFKAAAAAAAPIRRSPVVFQ